MMNENVEKILSECFVDGLDIKSVNYKGMFVPDNYEDIAKAIENFEIRDDDTWVCSFPKTGTTWTQEMVWSICNDIHSDAAKVPLNMRFPFIEFAGETTLGWIIARKSIEGVPDFISKSVEYSANIPSPRFLKTHLPFHLLPKQLRSGEKKCKIVYVVRDSKDTCISYFHHYKLFDGYVGNFENFAELFLADKVYCAPFWEHVIGYWEKRNARNILFLKYEDMKADLGAVIKRTATFLNKNLNEKQLCALKEHLSFESMKNNPSLNNEQGLKSANAFMPHGCNLTFEGEFIRKGVTQQWKTEMTNELINRFDRKTKEKLKFWPELRKQCS